MVNTTNINPNKYFKILDANMLRLLAIIFMLLDHMWATIIPGNQWMTWVGRMAFPIFAFQISEGFFHTRNFRKYAQRLFIFGIISEVPFNLFFASSIFYPFHQNVMFTLLLGLLAINGLEKARKDFNFKNIVSAIASLIGTCFMATIGFVDYGAMGVLTVVIFYLFRGYSFAWIGQLISLIILNMVLLKGMYIPIEIFGYTFEFYTQGFAVLSLIFIWLYNGKKGVGHPVLQYSFYMFYPIHMFILYLITRLI